MSSASCVFCQIIGGKVSADIIYRDQDVIAIRDIRPIAPVHVLLIPVRHVESVNELAGNDYEIVGRLYSVARALAAKEQIDRTGYRLVLNTGPDAGQSVFHMHLHLIGGRQMHWPPG